jgi:regulator of cell morphogenesis and NO signaling
MKNIAEQTLASIVTAHHQTVPVLEKYSLDFCCKGKRTLAEACTEKGWN